MKLHLVYKALIKAEWERETGRVGVSCPAWQTTNRGRQLLLGRPAKMGNIIKEIILLGVMFLWPEMDSKETKRRRHRVGH